ncbi:MAG: ATP-binding protein [Acidobacteria bacterium]|nr:MAG: ATP-binding protein [Acidobacteriota bacterium]
MMTRVLADETRGVADRTAALFPPAPTTLEAAGLSLDLMVQLVLKLVHFAGEMTGVEMARRLGVEFSVVEPALDFLKRLHQCEIVGGSVFGGPSYKYRITDAGRQRALLFLENNHYVGVAPVPLTQYVAYLEKYRNAIPRAITRARVREAFSHLVLSSRVLDQVGPAIAAAHSMFVYGPPGNGKTVIAQAIRNLLDGEIAVPHALEVEGSIIRLFDPVNHEAMTTPGQDADFSHDDKPEARWVRCRRPMVMVGGELTLEALELSYSPTMRFYGAPVQAVANGGVLVIDDFGRQRCSARDLLNRWIVPLESRVDFLTLNTGRKFELPFMLLVVFATNIRPSELVDEAFLRRIHYKVFAESPTIADFKHIFENCCREREIPYDDAIVEQLLINYYGTRNITPRGCHPRDLIDQALAQAAYLGEPRQLTNDLLEAACASYFVDDTDHVPVTA